MRELQNCIERAVILCEGDTIQVQHLSLTVRTPSGTPLSQPAPVAAPAPPPANGHPLAQIDLSGTMSETVKRVTAVVERVKLKEALRNAKGNKERAAEALQVSYKALLQKQREHGVSD